MQSLDIVVKYSCGTYTTSTRRGVRSSCTAGPRQAAELQGDKLFGEQFVRAECVSRTTACPSVWRLTASTEG